MGRSVQNLICFLAVALLAAVLSGCAGAGSSRQAGQTIRDQAALEGPDLNGDGRDIVTLIALKKIEVKVQGSGIQNVSLSARRLVPESLSVRIPAGTFFVSANPGAQNMVATRQGTLALRDGQWHQVDTPAACANLPRKIPGTQDGFRVIRSPHQAELSQLMPVLAASGADFPVRQAAVWIVTDNASYEMLGSLVDPNVRFLKMPELFRKPDGSLEVVSHEGETEPARVIDEDAAAQALKLCEQAGIDITKKLLWGSRGSFRDKVDDPALRAWLAPRQRQ